MKNEQKEIFRGIFLLVVRARFRSAMTYLISLLCALSVVVAQICYGGLWRPIFALPAFGCVALAGILGLVELRRMREAAPSFGPVLAVGCFAAWLIWRELAARDSWLASNYWALTVACLVIYLLFAVGVVRSGGRLVFVGVLLGMGCLQAGLAVWQHFNIHHGFPIPWMSEQLRSWYSTRFAGRAHGFYLNGNHLTWFLNAVTLFALSLCCWGRFKIAIRIFLFYVALMGMAGSLLAFSRGGIVGLLAGLAVFVSLSVVGLWDGGGRRNSALIVALLASVFAAAVLFTVFFHANAEMQAKVDSIADDSFRSSILAEVSRQFQMAPLLGAGPGTFLYFGRQFRTAPGAADDVFAHDDWAQLAADFGFPALALLLVAILLHADNVARFLRARWRELARRSLSLQENEVAIAVGASSSLAVFMLHSFFDFNMQVPANALLAAACFGMLASPAGLRKSSQPAERLPQRIVILLGAGSAIFLAAFVCRTAPAEFFWLEAENALLADRPGLAADYARKGLLASKTHPYLHRLLGTALLSELPGSAVPAQLREQAVQEFTRARDLAPGDFLNWMMLADLERRMGHLDLAEKNVVEAIRLSPDHARGFELYAMILERQGHLPEALRMCLVARQRPGAAIPITAINRLKDRLRAEQPH